MQFLHRTVSLLVVVCASNCTEPGICSDDGVFLGVARDREDKLCIQQIAMLELAAENFTLAILLSGFFSKYEK